MTNEWYNFYKKRINSGYQRYFEFKYHPFLSLILEQKPKQIYETGCGIGSVSKFIKQYNIGCLGFDIDKDVVDLANENLGTITFFQGDIFDYNLSPMKSNPILPVSHGVLEHFTDEQILKVLELYPYSIHYVPLEGYKTPSYGDERLLSKKFWDDLCQPEVSFTFNNGLDLAFMVKPK